MLTVANHISTLDDPLAWGSLPAHYYFRSRMTRWALGASDIMFTNPFFSTFFRLGQTLETMRGKGIYQPAVDFAIDQLNKGGWVHLYAEGKVNQPDAYPTDENGVAHLPRFKWGVGRMVMESTVPPIIIPMWLTGFDRLMPQGRAFPYNYLPRPGAELSVTFGNPIPPDSIRQGLLPPSTMDAVREVHSSTVEQLPKIRSRVTSVIHDAVEDLGRSVSGKLLYPPRQR